jgi:adenine-specific DNA-methyltransferase
MTKQDKHSKKPSKKVETLTHEEASRKNIPTAEYQSVMRKDELSPIRAAYERRNRDLDPQLVWRGKDERDWSDLVVPAPPVYIQEKVHPKVLIDDLQRRSETNKKATVEQPDLFADFNGLPTEAAKTEFYQHDAHWSNRMILGDSLQVMASLAEREGLRGEVQCIYIDPPYGIKFNSNFQWSTTSRDVKDGNIDHITREPEQVKAFRDTWRDGIHSYLTYLRDRLTVARDLLAESGSIFVQIGDENRHLIRALLDEVFGQDNFVSEIAFRTTTGRGAKLLDNNFDFAIWYARNFERIKYRQAFVQRDEKIYEYVYDEAGVGREFGDLASTAPKGHTPYNLDNFTSQGTSPEGSKPLELFGRTIPCPDGRHWRVSTGRERLIRSLRLEPYGSQVRCRIAASDQGATSVGNVWLDVLMGSFVQQKIYVVQTATSVIQRCLLMATDPGDLVLDPTCGSGTSAYVAEQWGRRWITIDTSRVALALARARLMGARYQYYLLADSRDGQLKEGEITKKATLDTPTHGDVRQGFVYDRVSHITLKSIADNAEIDVIWEKFQLTLEPLRQQFNESLGTQWEEWEIPRGIESKWPDRAKKLHAEWWEQRIARQKEIDTSIAAKAEAEYLYDKPYPDNRKVRVAGPFTVESLSPHRVLDVDENDELIDSAKKLQNGFTGIKDFTQMVLENLKTSGVQQAHKEDKISFSSIAPWPGELVCAEARYFEGEDKSGSEKRAALFVGPEFGTVSRPDLVAAAREAGDANFDVLITCAFNYDARSSEFNKLGRVPVLKARMNADLHMADDLKNTGKGNLFVIFGEPDIDLIDTKDGKLQVKVNGVDVFEPTTGEVRSDSADGIACWFIDTDYNEESFFVRHAYFLGANDPYKSLKTTLKAEINEEAWETLHSDISRPFDKPQSGRIAVKVINHLGDEVMKVFRVN